MLPYLARRASLTFPSFPPFPRSHIALQPSLFTRFARQVLPYLVRRAQENSAVVQGAAVQRQMAMLRSEIGRRTLSRVPLVGRA